MADTVAQGATWSDLTEPIIDADGAPITTAVEADFTLTLVDSADDDQSAGVGIVHATDGRYRLELAIAEDAAVGSWGGTITYTDGSLHSWEQLIDFAVVAEGEGGGEPTTPTLAADETLTLIAGFSYLAGEGDAIQFEDEAWTTYGLEDVGVAVWFAAITPEAPIRVVMEVLSATIVQLELTGTETYRMRGAGSYCIHAELPGQTDPVTLVTGSLEMQSPP